MESNSELNGFERFELERGSNLLSDQNDDVGKTSLRGFELEIQLDFKSFIFDFNSFAYSCADQKKKMPKNLKRHKPNKGNFTDPFEIIHSDLHQLILQHFDPADVLISSETNINWFRVIGDSKCSMKKINLGLENWWNTETPRDMSRVMRIVKQSTRKYQNVYINCNDDALVSRQAFRMLKALAPSIVDLRFLNGDKVSVKQRFKFPMLQRLQFINNVSEVDELFLQGSFKLRELNLKHHYLADPYPVFNCLKQNDRLIMLKLWDTGISQLFKLYEPGCFNFQLKRFATGCDGKEQKETEDNFSHFLKSQHSIEAIRFRSGLNGVNAKIINQVFEMKAIKIIHLDGIGDLKELKLSQPNPSIVELRLPWCANTLDKILPFLRVTPNISVLSIRKINKDILEHIAKHLKSLTRLNYTRADGCVNCFKKYLSSGLDINNNIDFVCKEWY